MMIKCLCKGVLLESMVVMKVSKSVTTRGRTSTRNGIASINAGWTESHSESIDISTSAEPDEGWGQISMRQKFLKSVK